MFTVELPRAVIGFVGVHLGVRAEVATIERAVESGDADHATRRARLLARVLYHHHTAEDTVLFPTLRARHPGASTTTAALEADHVELDVALDGLTADLDRASDVRRLVERHLGAEEQHVLPLWLAAFSAEEHEEFAGRLRRATPLRDAGLMISWLLDTAPEGSLEVAWSQVPPSLRLLHRTWWQRRYLRAFGTIGETPSVPLPNAGQFQLVGSLA